MMVVFWTYFCVPLLIGQNISGFSTMLCTLVIYESAYIAEDRTRRHPRRCRTGSMKRHARWG